MEFDGETAAIRKGIIWICHCYVDMELGLFEKCEFS